MTQLRAYNLAKALYQKSQTLKVTGPMRDQLERATLSVVLNVAEGWGKATPKDRKKFFVIALGSLREAQACLDLLNQKDLLLQADQVGANIYGLIRSPQQNPVPGV